MNTGIPLREEYGRHRGGSLRTIMMMTYDDRSNVGLTVPFTSSICVFLKFDADGMNDLISPTIVTLLGIRLRKSI